MQLRHMNQKSRRVCG